MSPSTDLTAPSLGLDEHRSSFSTIGEAIRELLLKYERPTGAIDGALADMKVFRVFVPLVGNFSAGKSSLLNRLMTTPRLPVHLSPETSVATEVSYAPEPHGEVIEHSGRSRGVTTEEIQSNTFDYSRDRLLKVQENSGFLARIPDVVIADLPGLESGFEAHERAIRDYIDRSVAYFIIVDVEDGTLKKNLKDFLAELRFSDSPVYVFLNKRDKKLPEEVDAILAGIRESIGQLMGHDRFTVAAVASKRGDMAPVEQALLDLQKRAGQLFHDRFRPVLARDGRALVQHLSIRLRQDNQAPADLDAEIAALQSSFDQWKAQTAKDTDRLAEQLVAACGLIADRVRTRLGASRDTLVSAILANRDLKPEVNQCIRLAVLEGTREDLEPRIQKYLAQLNASLPAGLEFESNLDVTPEQVDSRNAVKNLLNSGIKVLLAELGFVLLGPIGGLVALAISFVVDILFDKQQEAERKRRATEQLDTYLRHTVSEVQANLEDQVRQLAGQIREDYTALVAQQEQSRSEALRKLKGQKAMQQDEWARLQAELQADIVEAEALLERLG